MEINNINPLKAELKPICHLMALLGAHLIFHVSRIRVKPPKVSLSYLHSVHMPTRQVDMLP